MKGCRVGPQDALGRVAFEARVDADSVPDCQIACRVLRDDLCRQELSRSVSGTFANSNQPQGGRQPLGLAVMAGHAVAKHCQELLEDRGALRR